MTRTIGSARRSRNLRPSSRTLAIFGDGESEERYFQGFRGRDPAMRVRPVAVRKTGVHAVLKQVDGVVRESGLDIKCGDRVAIVMDVDYYTEEEIGDMLIQCDRRGYELYLSNPCFEVWLILHFRDFGKETDPKELVGLISSAMGREYRKSQGIDWNDDMLKRALRNAHSIQGREECTVDWCYHRNPSTMVHVLVESMAIEG